MQFTTSAKSQRFKLSMIRVADCAVHLVQVCLLLLRLATAAVVPPAYLNALDRLKPMVRTTSGGASSEALAVPADVHFAARATAFTARYVSRDARSPVSAAGGSGVQPTV